MWVRTTHKGCARVVTWHRAQCESATTVFTCVYTTIVPVSATNVMLPNSTKPRKGIFPVHCVITVIEGSGERDKSVSDANHELAQPNGLRLVPFNLARVATAFEFLF